MSISRPVFFAAQGTAVGSCADCGNVRSCNVVTNRNGDFFLVCGECEESWNVRDKGVQLSALNDKYGDGSVPDPF